MSLDMLNELTPFPSVVCAVLRDQHWQQLPWADIKVGDFVKILGGQSFPADLVLVSSRCVLFSFMLFMSVWMKLKMATVAS